MTWVMAIALWFSFFAGVYLLLSRDLMRCLFGVMMTGSAINLLVFMSGRVGSTVAPVIPAGQSSLSAQAANSVPQALVLTAIVISFTLACYALLLAVALLRSGASERIDKIRDAEPIETDPIKPPYAPDALEPVDFSANEVPLSDTASTQG